jgi:hypothetical protein
MKIFGVCTTTLLFLLLGTGISVYAQQDQREDAKPQTQEEEKPPKQEEAKPAKPEEDKNVKRDQEEKKDENVRSQRDRSSRQDESKSADHPIAQNRVGQGGRIPDDKFRAHFGREHTFRIGHPTVVGGQPRFQYGGYWFVMVDAWPAGWGYEDEVYVDYIDGVYYLIDPQHPGVQIVVNVVL